MPFADGVFDYAMCSHVLEHVPDPAAVVAELTRVGRAGYIEVPEAASAKILDFPSHLWWCRLDERDAACSPPSRRRAFDPEIAAYIERAGIERRLDRLLDSGFDHRVISLPWRGPSRRARRGHADPAFLAAAARRRRPPPRSAQALAARVLDGRADVPHRRGPSAPPGDPLRRHRQARARRGDGEHARAAMYRVADDDAVEPRAALPARLLADRSQP